MLHLKAGHNDVETIDAPDRKRYAMVMDLRRCIGCLACMNADKAEFDVPLGVWRTWVSYVEAGTYPNVRRHFMPKLCNHCDDPPCVRACPVEATYKHEDGFVLQRYNRCIGCRACIAACPYNMRHVLPYSRTRTKITRVVDKCTFCYHRVTKGFVPACAQTCIGRVRIFGDLNDPDSEVRKLVDTNPTVVLKPEMGTKPQVYYIFADRGHLQQELSYKTLSAQQREDMKAHSKWAKNNI